MVGNLREYDIRVLDFEGLSINMWTDLNLFGLNCFVLRKNVLNWI